MAIDPIALGRILGGKIIPASLGLYTAYRVSKWMKKRKSRRQKNGRRKTD